MADSDNPEIDWATAEMRDGSLVVELTGSAPKEWRKRFESVLVLLDRAGGGAWGRITVTKSSIEVARPEQGAESELRHFLESVVLQANGPADVAEGQARGEDKPQSTGDEEMAALFKAFADHPRAKR